MKDKRYTANLEFCGYSTKRNVVRFCGEFISQHENISDAMAAIDEHKKTRELNND